MDNKITLYRPPHFCNEVILVDGTGRAGKSKLHQVLSAFDGVELPALSLLLPERLSFLYYHNLIDKDAAKALIRSELQFKLFNEMMCRNVNFKFGDYSGVFGNANPWRYLKRMFLKDANVALQRIKEERTILQIMVHDTLGFPNLFFDTYKDKVYFLEMVNHPIDLINSKYRKKHDERWDTPLSFPLTMKKNGKLVPWWNLYDNKNEYFTLSSMDRTIWSTYKKLEHIRKEYQKLSPEQKKQVLWIPLEKMMVDPWTYIAKIEKLINRKPTKYMKKNLKKYNFPDTMERIIKSRKVKEELIRNKASPPYTALMEEMITEYETTDWDALNQL
ncbi:hypothetical protein COV17_00180 [Candidatus Woesearchaeota archaeon CG10_big_fil_rev_8_21_14_0_10_36_11]|nr:MAG: hypothetical protein COV17_00180 [Candidatus Woesearchaeota archaeon CG10_big_fil_rev_8_21_14_0_10_36_11]